MQELPGSKLWIFEEVFDQVFVWQLHLLCLDWYIRKLQVCTRKYMENYYSLGV